MDLLKILDGTPEPPIVSLTTSENLSGDYWLPVPMCEYQKELTDQVVSLHYSDILKYFETDDKEQVLLDSLEVLYLNSQLVATHPYLLIDHYMPKNLATKDTPNNLCDTSGKFKVLRDLISMLEGRSIDVALVGRSGKLLDMLESLLLGTRCNIKRHHGSNLKIPAKSQNTKNNKPKVLTMHIIPSDVDDFVTTSKFDLVISFDITPTNEFLQSLRKSTRVPILRLVSTNSIDHIALYFRQFHERGTEEYLVQVTAAIVVLRDQVGVLPPDLRPIYFKNLTYLKDWCEDFVHTPWPLPEMSSIRRYDAGDVERSLLQEVHYEKNTEPKREPVSYYEAKRLNKDYISNPLKEVNFGILSVNSKFSDALTHRLIQGLTRVFGELQLKLDELTHLEEFDNAIKDFTRVDESKLNDEIKGYNDRISSAISKSGELSSQIESLKSQIRQAEATAESLSTNTKLQRIKELKELISKEEHRSGNNVTEMEYMAKEIGNAEKSISDSDVEVEQLKKSIGENQQKVDGYWSNFQALVIDDSELKHVQERIESLKFQIEDSLTKLQNSKARADTRRNSPSLK
ncbi:unnamed protein product [Cyberlindnera jadinii]|uniref:HDA1 complex subunit 3 n=1 Tax=Cyberlindnera jadinii (strain ATCC 18201 / CBS 1600 / BCRC 20928 / JCM 3617 / NBRC 0987 / NRRL Y-1542) TaxID=983966 RepID=A0A0H5C8S6_CYBJN|nr:unnamed protein product [Cyberlindnera jadinii]